MTGKMWSVVGVMALVLGLASAPAGAGPVPVIDDSLQVWFDAGSGVTLDGSKVSAWADQASDPGQSGANNATQGTSDNQPTYVTNVINGHPVIRFDESTNSQYLDTGSVSGFNGCDTYTIFVVGIKSGTSTGDFDVFLSSAAENSDNLWSIYADSTDYYFFARNEDTSARYVNGSLGTGYRVLEIQWTSDDTIHLFLDGAEASANTGADFSPTDHSKLRIGATADTPPTSPLTGDIAEILIYNQVLTDTERNQVGAYLAQKYDLTTEYTYNFDDAPIAEPAGLGLLGLALLGLRKRRK